MTSKAGRLEAGPIPLYYQLEQDLRARIAASEFAPGVMLPSEDQICVQYSVSRITARRALETLHQQGVIVRRRGIGSFVVESAPGVNSRLTGSLGEFLGSAAKLHTRWLTLDPRPAPAEVRKTFGLHGDAEAYRLISVGSLAGEPVAYLEIWFPEDVGNRLQLDDTDLLIPVIRVVESRLNTRVYRAEQVVEADIAGELAGLHLGIAETAPLLKVKRVYFTSQERAIELAYVRYHPDRYRYAIDFR